MLEFDRFTFTYPGAQAPALDGLTLTIGPGEFVAVIGAGKSGKSSLCHALTGVIPHFFRGSIHGSVRVAGKDTAETGVTEMSTLAALVMQKPEHQLSGVRFSVREEVAFSLENRGVPPEEIRQRVDDALRRTGIEGLAHVSPHHLSGGQVQRLMLAAALAMDTPVLVLDEPTAALDPQGALETFALLKKLNGEGKTVVLSERRLDCIGLFADRVVALHNGKVALDGPPETVLVSSRMPEIGLDWTRYTRVAHLAMRNGLWRDGQPASATLEETCAGLKRKG